MTKNITQGGLIKIFILTACLVLAYMAFYPYMPAVTQRKNMVLAKEHSLILKRLICNDARFKKIVISGGSTSEKIYVGGFVKTDNDLVALQKLVSESKPPRPVKYQIQVEPLAFEE